MQKPSTYYAMTPLHHNNQRYNTGDKLVLTEKQAQHLKLNDKITHCSRAIRVLSIYYQVPQQRSIVLLNLLCIQA